MYKNLNKMYTNYMPLFLIDNAIDRRTTNLVIHLATAL